MAIPSKVLYPAKQNRGECHEAHGKDIMVDGENPKKFVPPSQPMFTNSTDWTRGTAGIDPGNGPNRTICAEIYN